MIKAEPVLQVRDLVTSFRTDSGEHAAVDGVSFSVTAGQTLGLVGESGCGKSVTSLSIMRLLPQNARVAKGRIVFSQQELLSLSEKNMRRIRGNQVGMIFQEPMTCLNPVFTVGFQIAEVFQLHLGLSSALAWKRAVEMLQLVRIPAADRRAYDYPHQLSGG